MILFPNAKINIGLNIVEKRDDGYHNIESVFYPVQWCDALECIPSDTFSYKSTGLTIAGALENNLIYKAYQLLKPYFTVDKEAKIHLHKAIPMGAGLGGGSADGAFALKLFNEVFQAGRTDGELIEMASKLGSDCPFFVVNKPSYVFDRGIKFEQVDLDLSNYFIVLVNPNIHISTQEAYAGVSPQPAEKPLINLIRQPISTWKENIKNDFENRLLDKYKEVAELKEELYKQEALYASMTGSGSTVYGIFDKQIDFKSRFPKYAMWQGPL